MAPDNKDSFFHQYGKYMSIQHLKKNAVIPFKDHVRFSTLVDILSRKEFHHAILCTHFSPKMHHYLLEALLLYLTHETTPYPLRCIDLIYLDIANLTFSKTKQKSIEKDFLNLHETLETSDKYILFLLPNLELLSSHKKSPTEAFLQKQMKILFQHPKCRFLAITHIKEYEHYKDIDDQFLPLHLSGPSEADIMIILKQERTALENFHHILIPEELLSYAYSLAERFLSTNNTIDQALLLLDSSSARAAAIERTDNTTHFKPILTLLTMTNVLAGWTQIPATHLQLHKFKHSEFIHNMQQQVFGQDTAITLLAHELQQSQAHLQQQLKPFCSLLFAGPDHSGKRTVAIALAEQLFKQPQVLYFAQVAAPNLSSLAQLKLQRYQDNQCLMLKDLIRQTPYAIIMFEQIDQSSAVILDGLQEIFSTGYLYDEHGNRYNTHK